MENWGDDPAIVLYCKNLARRFGSGTAFEEVSFAVRRGEVLGIVGESGAGKSTLLNCLSGRLIPSHGVVYYQKNGTIKNLYGIGERERRRLLRTEIGVVVQNPREGLRLNISAGGNISEKLMAEGIRNYGTLRRTALEWLERVEIDKSRIDDKPSTFSGGMLQRLQIARNLVTKPKLLFLDEPTAGLDVSVQARLLDLLRRLVQQLRLSVIMVSHDLAVARVLSHRLFVMKEGKIVESGLTDQILDDPRHPYTQLLVACRLQP